VDDRLAIWVATHRYAPLNDAFVWLGTIEKLGAVWIVLAVLAGIVTRRGIGATIRLAVLTAVTTFLADAASFGLKDVVHRTRPFVAHPEIHPLYAVHSSSFPAGHAATAFAGATILAWAVPRAMPLFALLAVAIGFSRVYDGVHYPGDVLGGAMLGELFALGAVATVEALAPRVRSASIPGLSRPRAA
jgi:membrane-associated phospholipid phosphatase